MELTAKEIGKRIKQYRKAARITQKELAEMVGCAEMTISQYERGLYSPKIDTRIAIAKALNVPYNTLFAPTDTDLASMLPEVGVSIENDPDPAKTQADFDRARVEDVSLDLMAILEKSGLVTYVSGRSDCPYYLRGKDQKIVRLNESDFKDYSNWQYENIINQHYGYVDLKRKIEGLSSDTNGSADAESTSPDA